MLHLNFLAGEDINHFDPELIAAHKASDENTDLDPLYEKYGYYTVVDAMFNIDKDNDNVHPESDWFSMSSEDVEEWLWEFYGDHCLPDIEKFFLNRRKPRTTKEMIS